VCDGVCRTWWSTASQHDSLSWGWTRTRNRIVKSGNNQTRHVRKYGCPSTNKYMLSPIALYLKPTTRALCHPRTYPPTFISTWRTWKVVTSNQIGISFWRALHGRFPSVALLQRFARAAFCFVGPQKSSEREVRLYWVSATRHAAWGG
jgi:hypothetical protein